MSRSMFRMKALTLFLLLILGASVNASHGKSSCESESCKEALATVKGYVDGQAISFYAYDIKAWMPYTANAQAPSGDSFVVFKKATIEEPVCSDRDHCTVKVVYDTIGTLVPFESFAEKHETIAPTYSLVRTGGRLAIAGPLPAKFVNVETSVEISGSILTGSPPLRAIYDAIARQISDAAK